MVQAGPRLVAVFKKINIIRQNQTEQEKEDRFERRMVKDRFAEIRQLSMKSDIKEQKEGQVDRYEAVQLNIRYNMNPIVERVINI